MAIRGLLLGALALTANACGDQRAPSAAPSASPEPAATTVQAAPTEPTPAPSVAAEPPTPAAAEPPTPAPSVAAEPAPAAEVDPWAAEQAAAERAAAAGDHPPYFLSPRNDFECGFTPKGGIGIYTPEDGGPELSCDYDGKGKYVRVDLGRSGPAKLYARVFDWHCCGGDYVLPDDSHWAIAPFSCDLKNKKLECRRDDDGQGFVIDSKGMRLSQN